MHNPLQIFHDDPSPPTRPLCSSIAYSSNFRSHAHFHALWTVLLSIYRSIKCFMPVCMQRKRSISTVRFFSVLVSRDFMDHWWWRAHSYQPAEWIFPSLISFVFFFPSSPNFFLIIGIRFIRFLIQSVIIWS